ncbi:MAG TPA: hypothetical protein VD948_02930 [Rhodothermales bacterium]|nr:hypothetical protein [Rhodothermales bacterium]
MAAIDVDDDVQYGLRCTGPEVLALLAAITRGADELGADVAARLVAVRSRLPAPSDVEAAIRAARSRREQTELRRKRR